MSPPRATMRLQFHGGFTFADAAALAPYFAALGISHLYASPIMTARHGSWHGYDVIDPTRVNPELGGETALRGLVQRLRDNAMGLIVDLVPNHMAVGGDNPWWTDVLAHGRQSAYAKFFDIDWNPPRRHLHGKLLLPILGRPYGEALAAGEISLAAGEDGAAAVRYFDHVLPIAADGAGGAAGETADAFDPRSVDGRARLHRLLERQHYRLAWWRAAGDEINWRRFFDINDLAAIRVEDEEVFEAVHGTLLRLYAAGLIDGVRVDHVDGLADPEGYCRKLRRRLGDLEHRRPAGSPAGDAYLVVEKILGRGERLAKSWHTDGTTGYDFMDDVGALLHDAAGEPPLRALWQRLGGRAADFAAEEELARRQILQRSFSAQRDAAVQALYEIAQGDLATRDFSRAVICRALTEILAHFPVYRTYARVGHASAADRAFLSQAVAQADGSCLPGDRWMIRLLGRWLAGERIRPRADRAQALALVRFQQLSASLSAKSVEDTAFYRYGRLVSRNEVGSDGRRFAATPAQFHDRMQARVADHRHAMLATATHDHKRGEDVRARLAVLSELADDWARAVERWIGLGAPLRSQVAGAPAPTTADLALLFQTIVGAWPFGLAVQDRPGLAAFAARIAHWQEKALREAKLVSDWSCPDESYERAAKDFIARLFSGPSDLLDDIAGFVERIAPAGVANSLAQVLIKLTAPGVPDIYQGTEYWDFSLVDPDNRRGVDFAKRRRSLARSLSAQSAADWTDGRVKQALIARALAVRRHMPRLFSDGAYLPLAVEGPLADHVVAFARCFAQSASITLFCRLTATFLGEGKTLRIPAQSWQGTRVILPAELGGRPFANALRADGEAITGLHLGVAPILATLPVALLTRISDDGKGAATGALSSQIDPSSQGPD